MTGVLQDFSDAALNSANVANLFAYYDHLARSTAPLVDYHDGAEFKWFVTGLSTTFFNQVLRAELASGEVDMRLEDVLGYFSRKGVHYLQWWLEPGAQPARLAKRLEARGFIQGGGGHMAVDLQQLDEGMVSVDGLAIERVTSAEGLQVWMDTALAGFGVPLAESAGSQDMYLPLGFDLPFRYYLGRWNGRPVATSQFFLAEGVAGLYCVATLKEARRRGIGAAMSTTAMLEARDLGYRIGILQASAMGAPVYQRMGFFEHSSPGFYYRVPSDGS